MNTDKAHLLWEVLERELIAGHRTTPPDGQHIKFYWDGGLEEINWGVTGRVYRPISYPLLKFLPKPMALPGCDGRRRFVRLRTGQFNRLNPRSRMLAILRGLKC
jgi:hypothetical protein